jgi:hypothetical protein
MNINNTKKNNQLGMPFGTASNRLRKMVLFDLLVQSGKNYCFQCNKLIQSVDELSIEHKIPWLDSENPKLLFFDVCNIAFSHLNCNVGARDIGYNKSKFFGAKLTLEEVKQLKLDSSSGIQTKELSNKFGISEREVRNIKSSNTWKG